MPRPPATAVAVDAITHIAATVVAICLRPSGLVTAFGVNIVMGSSYYVAGAHPTDMDARTEDGIFAAISAQGFVAA